MAQLFLKERKMAFTSQPLYSYEYHPESLSHQRLSKRAFEEFDNVRKVYELTSTAAPKYAGQAFANVIGSCMKLHLLYHSSHATDNEYREDYTVVHNYLRRHLSDVLKAKHFTCKAKIVAVALSMFPKAATRFLNKA